MIRLTVDLEELEDYPTIRLPGFAHGLLVLIPTLQEHTCSFGEPGGFVRRMTEDGGTWLGHVLEHVAIELQVLVGTPVTERIHDCPLSSLRNKPMSVVGIKRRLVLNGSYRYGLPAA